MKHAHEYSRAQHVSAHVLIDHASREVVGRLVLVVNNGGCVATLYPYWSTKVDAWGGEPAGPITDRDLYANQAREAVARAALAARGCQQRWSADDPTRGMEWRGILEHYGIDAHQAI